MKEFFTGKLIEFADIHQLGMSEIYNDKDIYDKAVEYAQAELKKLAED